MSSAKAYFLRAYFLYLKRIHEFSRITKNLLKNSGKLSAEYHRFLPAGCMCKRAVNRQPGYRARNLQRRGLTRPREFSRYPRSSCDGS